MNASKVALPFSIESTWPDADTLEQEQENKFTIVHCTYYAKPKYVNGGWVTIWPTTYLVHPVTNERLQLQHALSVPVAPERHFFKRAGECKKFTLIFPQVPEDWTTFHLKEFCDSGSGFYVFDLPRNEQGIYRVQFT